MHPVTTAWLSPPSSLTDSDIKAGFPIHFFDIHPPHCHYNKVTKNTFDHPLFLMDTFQRSFISSSPVLSPGPYPQHCEELRPLLTHSPPHLESYLAQCRHCIGGPFNRCGRLPRMPPTSSSTPFHMATSWVSSSLTPSPLVGTKYPSFMLSVYTLPMVWETPAGKDCVWLLHLCVSNPHTHLTPDRCAAAHTWHLTGVQ